MPMQVLEVGKPYPGRATWPEGVIYEFRAGTHDLIVSLKSPTKNEIAAVREGEVEFGLLIASHVLFVISEFRLNGKAINTADSPYNWWLNNEAERVPPFDLPNPTSKILLPITLVDAATGIVKVLHAVSLSPEFSRRLHQAIRDQAATPLPGLPLYNQAIDAVYRRYPTADRMLEKAVIRCKGGD
jgi:hypothetical protein